MTQAYTNTQTKQLGNGNDGNKVNNQVLMTGDGETYLVAKGIFMLEVAKATTGNSLVIKDANSTWTITGVEDFSNDHSPIRCDYGVIIIGDIQLVKGYVLEDVFP